MFTSQPPLKTWTLPAILLLLTLFGAAAPPASAAGPRTVPLLIGDQLDEQGKPRPLNGARLQLIEALQRELNVVFEVHMYPWVRAERYALDGAGLIFGLPKTDERLRTLRYSEPASHRKLWLVTRSDATFKFNTLDDLRGKTLGIVRGYSYGEEFDRARAMQLFRTDEDISSRGTRLTRLMLKRVDAVLLFQPSAQTPREIETDLAAFMAPRLRAIGAAANAGFSVLPKPLDTDTSQYFAIARAKDDGIIDRINAALPRIQQRPPN
jgi:ABC-type amino acid transport substrate-binding protein